MKLMDIYYNLENPLEKDLYKLLEAYSNPNGMYAGLITSSNRDYSENEKNNNFNGKYNDNDKDKFYAKITNIWLDNIKNIKDDNYQGKNESFKYLKNNYISKIDKVSTKEEADNVLKGTNEDYKIQDALKLYNWKMNIKGSFEHVTNAKINTIFKEYPKVEHRLYINPNTEDLYEFMNYFIDKCQNKELNYYFKFSKTQVRDDLFVIYSSTKDLTKYIDILKDIEQEHPSLVSRFNTPPILSGKLNNWIGYGSEPVELNKSNFNYKYSFNSLRENDILKPAINDVTKNWIKKHIDKSVVYKGKEVPFKNLVSYMVVDDIVKTLKEKIEGKSLKESINEIGICDYDLNSPQVLKDIYRITANKTDINLENYCNSGTNSLEKISFGLRNNKQYNYFPFQLERVLKNLPKVIAQNDKSYINDIKTAINKKASLYKININKFCLDNYALKKFQEQDYYDLRDKSSNKRQKDLNDMFDDDIKIYKPNSNKELSR